MDELEMELEFDGDFITQGYDFRKEFYVKDKSGYIALTLPASASVAVAISQVINEQNEISQFRIYCGGDAHNHSLYVDSKMVSGISGTVPTSNEVKDDICVWYIPIEFSTMRKECVIYVTGIILSVSNDINAEFVDEAPQTNVYPASIYAPVTPADNGKILIVKDGVWTVEDALAQKVSLKPNTSLSPSVFGYASADAEEVTLIPVNNNIIQSTMSIPSRDRYGSIIGKCDGSPFSLVNRMYLDGYSLKKPNKTGVVVLVNADQNLVGALDYSETAKAKTIAVRDASGRLYGKTIQGLNQAECLVNNDAFVRMFTLNYLNYFSSPGQTYSYTPYSGIAYGWQATASQREGRISDLPTDDKTKWYVRILNPSKHAQTVRLLNVLQWGSYTRLDQFAINCTQYTSVSNDNQTDLLMTIQPSCSAIICCRNFASSSGSLISQIFVTQ